MANGKYNLKDDEKEIYRINILKIKDDNGKIKPEAKIKAEMNKKSNR